MNHQYHFSRFNVTVPEGEEVAIYNSFAGSLAVLSLKEYAFLERLVHGQVEKELDENLSDLISRCLLDNFIIRDGYIICSSCGFIVESFTNEDFHSIGYLPLGKRRRKKKKKKKLNITNRI